MANRFLNACAVVLLLSAASAGGGRAGQPDPAQDAMAAQNRADVARFQAGLDKAARLLENDPRLAKLTHEQRRADIEFVTGNMLFALLHELGHAHIQEMGLPVLGREEDAADAFATLRLLRVGGDLPHHVLVAAAKGWFLSAERDEKEGTRVPFYDEHGLDKQRAYNIICLMVGSDLDAFADLATQAKMPQDRQETCAGDYSNAHWSWHQLLKPHLRAPDQPKQKISVVYGPGGGYADVAAALRAIGMLEILAEHEAENFTWRRPITFEAQACGQPDLHWDLSSQRILVCYEMATDFGHLYRDYGLTNDAFAAQLPQKKQR
jgi:Putative metallopeptidase